MRAFDDVVGGFTALGIAGKPAAFAQAAEVLATGEKFVNVGLVTGVEDECVLR